MGKGKYERRHKSMIAHYIITSSSYSKGTRIAHDYAIETEKTTQEVTDYLKDRVKKIYNECGIDVSVSTHLIHTGDKSWESVSNYDGFFKGVEEIKDLDEFISTINKDRELKGTDIAKYILTKKECTHLKLQKLVYFCYAEYLTTHDKLFEDTIYAFRYGPVVESVYEKYKFFGSEKIANEDNEQNICIKSSLELPARSRITFAKNGLSKWYVVDEVLKKYGDLTAGELVNLTHKKNTPWYVSPKEENYSEISDENILKYHKNETI